MTKASRKDVNVDNCAREQIHIPGSIQSFGYLIAFSEDLTITRASENIEGLTGQKAAKLVGMSLSEILNPEDLKKLDQSGSELRRRNAVLTLKSGTKLGCIMRAAGKECFLDLVPNKPAGAEVFVELRDLSEKLSKASSIEDLAKIMVKTIKGVSNFDRVKLYKFDKDWHGEVIAEARNDDMPSYKGLHFPESDIPKQARELYVRNRVRVIANVDDEQSAIYQKEDAKPLDLSFSFVRSVSSIHLQYLRNMDVQVSMSISILQDGEFWGLIACHNKTPRVFDLFEADFYKTAGELLSNRLTELSSLEIRESHAERFSLTQQLVSVLNKNKNLEALITSPHSLDDFIRSTGVAAVIGDKVVKRNAVPDSESLESLVSWLDRDSRKVFQCDDLPSRYNRDIGSYACGLLAVRLDSSNEKPNWLIWFRPEVALEVDWAGDPFSPKTSTPFGDRLFPRTSFELWKEVKKGHASPWSQSEIETAKYLADVLSGTLR